MIIGGVLIATALITYLAYYKKPVNKYIFKIMYKNSEKM